MNNKDRKNKINRYDSDSRKYATVSKESNIIPLHIGDIDYPAPVKVVEALYNRLKHPVFGYPNDNHEFNVSLRDWLQSQYQFDTNTEEIIYTPGIMLSLIIIIRSFTEVGDNISVLTPLHGPILRAITQHGRVVKESPLLLTDNIYKIDWQSLETSISKSKLFILCNPHNPIGKVYTEEELFKIGKICKKYNVPIFSDEVYSDIVYSPAYHIPIASLNDDLSKRTITAYSPGKTFSITGLKGNALLVKDKETRIRIINEHIEYRVHERNVFGQIAFTAAYKYGEDYKKELLKYLEINKTRLENTLANSKKLNLCQADGLFLAWIDCRKLKVPSNELADYFLNELGLLVDDGVTYGEEGKGFIRLNYGVDQELFDEVLSRLSKIP